MRHFNSYRILFVLLVFALIASGCSQTGDREQAKIVDSEWDEIQQEVWQMEEQYWAYLQNSDLDGYMTLWHPDFIGWPRAYDEPINIDSVRPFIKKIMDNSKPGSLSYKLTPYAVNVFGNIAIVFYSHNTVYENTQGELIHLAERITHTWMKHDGSWKIVGGISAL